MQKLFLSIFLMFSMFSCVEKTETIVSTKVKMQKPDTTVSSRQQLVGYFRTDAITFDTASRIISVGIENSTLLTEKRKKMGNKWESPEAWVSVAATNQANSIDTSFDSLVYYVDMNGETSRYAYSREQLHRANRYISICTEFANHLNERNYSAIKKILSEEITGKYNDAQLKKFFKATFKDKEIEGTELIGTKIVGLKYSFYINFCFTDKQIQTYVFSFVGNDNRIAGIQIPK